MNGKERPRWWCKNVHLNKNVTQDELPHLFWELLGGEIVALNCTYIHLSSLDYKYTFRTLTALRKHPKFALIWGQEWAKESHPTILSEQGTPHVMTTWASFTKVPLCRRLPGFPCLALHSLQNSLMDLTSFNPPKNYTWGTYGPFFLDQVTKARKD